MKNQVVEKTELDKAKELIEQERAERLKRATERIQQVLEEEKAVLSVALELQGNQLIPSIKIQLDEK